MPIPDSPPPVCAAFSEPDERMLDLLDAEALLLLILPKPLKSGTSASSFGLAVMIFPGSAVFELEGVVMVAGCEETRLALVAAGLMVRLDGGEMALGFSGEIDRALSRVNNNAVSVMALA